MEKGEVPLQSYTRLTTHGTFSEELLEKILRGLSAQKYAETVIQTGKALGVSPSVVSHKRMDLTAMELKEFQAQSLADFEPFAVFPDTIHRGGGGVSRHTGHGREWPEDGPRIFARLF